MEQVKMGDTVKVSYVIRLKDNTQVSMSKGRQHAEFRLGDGSIMPEFEEKLVGMAVGQTETVAIPAELAFGETKDELLTDVKNDNSPKGTPPVTGHTILVKQPSGKTLNVTVRTSDRNRLALEADQIFEGKELVIDAKLADIIS